MLGQSSPKLAFPLWKQIAIAMHEGSAPTWKTLLVCEGWRSVSALPKQWSAMQSTHLGFSFLGSHDPITLFLYGKHELNGTLDEFWCLILFFFCQIHSIFTNPKNNIIFSPISFHIHYYSVDRLTCRIQKPKYLWIDNFQKAQRASGSPYVKGTISLLT